MRKNLLLFLFWVLSVSAYSQQSGTAIAEINNGVFVMKDNQPSLVKAFEWTFRDGTKVSEMKIEQMGNTYYLVATCAYQGRKRIAAVDLILNGIEFVLPEEAMFKMCSAVACETCKFFLENQKIVACKCEETGTISNHCHYKASSASSFYSNFQRSLKMRND